MTDINLYLDRSGQGSKDRLSVTKPATETGGFFTIPTGTVNTPLPITFWFRPVGTLIYLGLIQPGNAVAVLLTPAGQVITSGTNNFTIPGNDLPDPSVMGYIILLCDDVQLDNVIASQRFSVNAAAAA